MMQLCRVKAVGKISQRDHAQLTPGRSKGVPWLIRPMWGREAEIIPGRGSSVSKTPSEIA